VLNVGALPADVCAAGHSKNVIVAAVSEPTSQPAGARRHAPALSRPGFLTVGRLRAGDVEATTPNPGVRGVLPA
jgi:hypothetical protein